MSDRGWFRMWKDTVDDPRLLSAASEFCALYTLATWDQQDGTHDLPEPQRIGFARNALLGALVTLWRYADTHIRNDDTLRLDSATLDALVGLEGFSSVIPVDWVQILDDGTVKLPGYCTKNDLIAKEKRSANNKARQAAFRARAKLKSNGVHNASVTHNVTRNEPVTKCVDQDQDLDQDQDKKPEVGASAPRSPTATRIPEAFGSNPDRDAYATAQGLDPAKTMVAFLDYWKAASGQNARKHDWDATWRTWCRRATEGRVNGSSKSMAPSEAKRKAEADADYEYMRTHGTPIIGGRRS